jgi:hypothetical protein
MTRSLKGERRFDFDDAVALSNLIKQPLDEIAKHLGYKLEPRGVEIVGKITGDGRISTVSGRKGELSEVLGLPGGAQAYIAETRGTPLEAYDGAIVVVAEPAKNVPVPPDAFGRLCIVEADGQMVPLIGTLGKAPQRGSVALSIFGTGEQITLHRLHRAAIVLAITFA